MPEGDTIHRTADTLRTALRAATIVRFEMPRLRVSGPAAGERVDDVEARGKHLLIRCSGGLTVHTHMRMSGSWHVYRPGERWRRSRGAMVLLLETEETLAVCFSAPVVEVLRPAELARHPRLTALGPDLCLPAPDLDKVTRRLDRLSLVAPGVEIGVALLDQTVAAGIGNVYRCEVAWACGVDPFRRLVDVDDAVRRSLYATAHRLLRANLSNGPRSTVPQGLAVYERAGRPCRRCGTAIEARRQGTQARVVWWCPACQT
ncbi:MAG: Fpg/Nei family DNA glycosylase [Actinomycetota bacterium]